MSKYCFIVIVALVSAALNVLATNETTGTTVMMRKSISAETELLVVRGREIPVAAVGGLLTQKRAGLLTTVYDVRIELHSKDASRMVLGSIIFGSPKGVDGPELYAMEMAIADGQLVLILGAAGELWAYKWDFGGSLECQQSVANLEAAYWSLLAKPDPVNPKDVEVKLKFTARETWQVEVAHRVRNHVQRTTFAQVKGAWEFRVTSRE